MIEEYDKNAREKIKITVGWIKRKKVREILETISFTEPTKYIKAYEKKRKFSSDFTIELCFDKTITGRVKILLAALGELS
jgi:hypothetical protein